MSVSFTPELSGVSSGGVSSVIRIVLSLQISVREMVVLKMGRKFKSNLL